MRMFQENDAVLSCFRVANGVTVDLTDSAQRVYRDVVSTPGQWKAGDTIKVKNASFPFFGYNSAREFDSPAMLCTLSGSLVPTGGNTLDTTTSGQGTTEMTITLNEDVADGAILVLYYRVGVPATYGSLKNDRKNDRADRHYVALDADHPFKDIFNKEVPSSYFKNATVTIKREMIIDGLSIQAVPPVDNQ
ncbi:MAG: hypothetical protein AAFN81_32245 [Bacteroidota bacterium]